MSRTITFNELRRIKNRLPEGSIHDIADKLNLPVQSLEPGPDGGLVVLDDPQILDMALDILEKEV